MKRLWLLVSVLSVTVLCATTALAATAPPAGWKKVGSPISSSCYHLSFSTATGGVALIGNNVKRTSNGGATWSTVSTLPAGFRLWDIAMGSSAVGYVVGSKPIDPSDPYSNSKCAVYVTKDGGETWLDRSLDATGGTFYRVAAVGADHAWAVGDGFRIYATSDGGDTWVRQNGSPDVSGRLESVYFLNDTTGWAAGAEFSPVRKGVVFRTTDGGATWKRVNMSTFTKLSAIGFSDATHGWTAGYEGQKLYKTSDGGATWKSVSLKNFTGTPHAIGFATPSKGWMVAGVLWQTVNGGKVWSRYLTKSSLWTFSMPSRTRAYAFVGIGGGKMQLYRWSK